MAVKLQDPETRETDAGKKGGRWWPAGRLLPVLSVLLALVVAGLISWLLFGGEAVEEERDVLLEAVAGLEEENEAGSPAPLEEASFDAEALRERIEEITVGYGGAYGVAILEPGSGTRISSGGDEEFVAASIGKLPPLATLYAAAERGEIDLDEEITVRPEDAQGYGSGDLHNSAGSSVTLRETAYRLVNDSDNTAWVMLDRYLGVEEIQGELEDMGMEDSSYLGHGYDRGYYTTPNDMLLLLEKISDPGFTSEEFSVEMLEAMTETNVEDRIPAKLPSGVRVAHKTGSYEGNFGDAGVVFYEDAEGVARRYYLVVLAEGAGEGEARNAIQDVSLDVYETLTGEQVEEAGEDASAGAEQALAAPAASAAPEPAPPKPAAETPATTSAQPTAPAPKTEPARRAEPDQKTESAKTETAASPPPAAKSPSPPAEYTYYYPVPEDYGSYYYYEPAPEEDVVYYYYEPAPEEDVVYYYYE